MGNEASSVAGMYEASAVGQHALNRDAMWRNAQLEAQADTDTSQYATNPFSAMPTEEGWENLTELSQDLWRDLQRQYAVTGLIPGMTQKWRYYDDVDQRRAKREQYLSNYQYGHANVNGQQSAFAGATLNQDMAGMPKDNAPTDYYSTIYAPEGYWEWQTPDLLQNAMLWQTKDYSSDSFDKKVLEDLEGAYNRYYTPPEYSYNISRPSMATGGGK